ncbi:MAG TPA: ATP-dependent zinc metalloprotease FtsH [Bacteroidales bacterium]|nr:ATP-dependent zinc metalloprotease FtsH [Bacteroidales bacterium]
MAESNTPKSNKNEKSNGKSWFNSSWLFAILLLTFIVFQVLTSGKYTQKAGQREIEAMVMHHDIEKVVIVNEEQAEIYLFPDSLKSGRYPDFEEQRSFGLQPPKPHFYHTFGTVELFQKFFEEAQDKAGYTDDQRIYPDYQKRKDYLGTFLGVILPFILIAAVWIYFMRRMSSGAGGGAGNIFSVGKSKAQIFDKDTHIKINFNDVAGLEEAKTEVMEIVDFLKNPKKYTSLGGKIPKGALLVGPPGTGKTLLAKAVAGEANVPFFSISGSDFVEMFVGVGASRVRDLFKQAKEKAPCIVFIDEIDAVGRARGRNPNFGANDERENTLNQLLTEMDGFGTNSGVIILAATNRADILDKALLRAGRFDRQIHVELPDLKEREAIFKVHLRPIKLEEGFDIAFLAKQTPGFSGADIANVCNEAALIAARGNKTMVQKQDFLDAIDRIIGGLEKKNKIISMDEKKTIAYHEAGHATVSWLLEHASPLLKVTIIPRGKALGAAWYLPEERSISTREHILDELAYALGGRAAEELVIGKISTGALSDLEKVTKQAYAMVAYFGMSDEVGNISFYDSSGQSEYGFTKPYSEKTAELIDSEAKKIVEESYLKAKEVISSNIAGLTQLAEQLLEKEVIFSEDLERIFGKRRGDKHAEAAAAEAATAGSSAGEGGVAGASATEAATAGSSAGESGVTGSQAREAEAPAAPATEVPGPGNGE